MGAGRSAYSARHRRSAPEYAYPRAGYRLRSKTMARTRQASAGSYSYRSRAQIIKKLGDPNGLIHRLGRGGPGERPRPPGEKIPENQIQVGPRGRTGGGGRAEEPPRPSGKKSRETLYSG